MKTKGLDFLTAVRALQDGKCEGIYHSDWTQKFAPQVLIIKEGSFAWHSGHPFVGFNVGQMLNDCWQLFNPVQKWQGVIEGGHLTMFVRLPNETECLAGRKVTVIVED